MRVASRKKRQCREDTSTGAVVFVVIGLRGLYTPRGTDDMNARVKNLKLQAKAATMIMAPRNASALECVVATKPLPVRRRSSVGVRREGRVSRMFFFVACAAARSLGQLLICFRPAAYVAQRLA